MPYNSQQVSVLQAERTNDPLVLGYSTMNDTQFHASVTAQVRDKAHNPHELLQYVTLEKFRTGNLFGRIKMVADARPVRAGNVWQFAPLPLGAADADITVTQDQVAAALSFVRILDTDVANNVNLLDSRIDSILNDLGPSGCEAIGGGDKTAIQALSQNQQSRAQELGLPNPSLADVGRTS